MATGITGRGYLSYQTSIASPNGTDPYDLCYITVAGVPYVCVIEYTSIVSFGYLNIYNVSNPNIPSLASSTEILTYLQPQSICTDGVSYAFI